MARFVLTSIVSARGDLLDWRVALEGHETNVIAAHAKTLGASAYVLIVVEAPTREAAYTALLCEAVAADHEALASFWRRVRAVPRIRVAAARHTGLRGVHPLLQPIAYADPPATKNKITGLPLGAGERRYWPDAWSYGGG